MIKINESTASKAFAVINRKIFNGILDQPKWDIDYLDTEYGYYVDGTIGLTDFFDTKADFLDTLCHEMIHLCQDSVFEMEPDHGRLFNKMAKFARKQGVML